jgi:hypothetical protein
MSHLTETLEQASIRQSCKVVRTPAVAANFMALSEQAIKEQHSHVRSFGSHYKRESLQ